MLETSMIGVQFFGPTKGLFCVLATSFQFLIFIYNQLSRSSTARGSGSVLSLGGPAKVKACKSFIFTEGSLKV